MQLITVIVVALVLGTTMTSGLKILNADNFEHDTQAATGQTTGVWYACSICHV
jgi:hypothetical protein